MYYKDIQNQYFHLKFQLKLDEAGFKKQLNTLMQEKEEAERLS